jgi:hypothetical protein
MTRQPGWIPSPKRPKTEAESALSQEIEKHASVGLENITVFDRAIWLDHLDPQCREWIVAIERIDKKGDKSALVSLLTQTSVPLAFGPYLADLFERRPLGKKQGRQARPSYEENPFLRGMSEGSRQWVQAIRDADNDGETGALIEKMKSDIVPDDVGIHLADLVSRHHFKKRRGNQAAPAYDRTYAEALLAFAIDDVHEMVQGGMLEADALDKASKIHDIPNEPTLANAYHGRRGSARRMKKRRP